MTLSLTNLSTFNWTFFYNKGLAIPAPFSINVPVGGSATIPNLSSAEANAIIAQLPPALQYTLA
jgi:hypothetical protein